MKYYIWREQIRKNINRVNIEVWFVYFDDFLFSLIVSYVVALVYS